MSNDPKDFDPENKTTVDMSDPKIKAYQERIAAAKSGRTPVGGAPMPKMPRLDQPPPGAPRDRALGVQQSHQQQASAQGQQPSGSPRSGHAAMSPDQYQQALATGQAVPGVGGAYVGNQPKGFQAPQQQAPPPEMERSNPDQPVNPPRADGGLSADTVAGLNAVAEANKQQEEAEEEKKIAEEVEPDSGDQYDDYDFGTLGRATRDLLSNTKRRATIEDRLEEMSFEDLILNQELRQEVKIKEGFVPTFRTPSGEEDLYTKRRIGAEDGSDRYIMDKYAALGLVCGLYAINGRPLPSHLNSDGTVDDKKFDEKMAFLLKYPIVIVADLSVNFSWFTVRVQKLLSLDKVKDF